MEGEAKHSLFECLPLLDITAVARKLSFLIHSSLPPFSGVKHLFHLRRQNF